VETLPPGGFPEVARALKALVWKPSQEKELIYFWADTENTVKLKSTREQAKWIFSGDLKSSDKQTVANALKVLCCMGITELAGDMAEALLKCEDTDVVEAFLNSRQPELRQAAERWAQIRGIKVIPGSRGTLKWGQWK
jgi:hypothetical protein